MHSVYFAEEIRAAERAAIELLPRNELMHRAAFGLHCEIADLLRKHFGKVAGRVGLGLIGSGNNGSDTLWALSQLARRGVRVYAVKSDSRQIDHTDKRFEEAGGTWLSFSEATALGPQIDFWLDGIVGLNSKRPITADWLTVIAACSADAIGVAVDVPSGVVVDTGELSEAHVISDYTVTFGGLKVALVKSPAAEVAGEVRLVDIGLDLPRSSQQYFEDADSDLVVVVPDSRTHKYNRGVFALIAGSTQYPGAGMLAARAAQNGGAGVVMHFADTAVADPLAASVLHKSLSEFSSDSKITATVFGPGVSENELSHAATILRNPAPLVLDAGAIQHCFAYHSELIAERKAAGWLTVLTPHTGELNNLLKLLNQGLDLTGVANTTGCVIYRKGARGEIYAPNGEIGYVRRASAFLATAGSGDVLAGLLGSLIAQNPTANPIALVATAVLQHTQLAESLLAQGEIVTADSLTHAPVPDQ